MNTEAFKEEITRIVAECRDGVKALEIVSLECTGNQQQGILHLTSKEEKEYRIRYTSQGITVQSIVPLPLSSSSSSSSSAPSLSSFVSSTDHPTSVVPHTNTLSLGKSSSSSTSSSTRADDSVVPLLDQIIYDNLHTLLLHLSNEYSTWYMDTVVHRLSSTNSNGRRNDQQYDNADYDEERMRQYLEERARFHADNDTNDDENNVLEWDERLMFAAAMVQQQQQIPRKE